MRTPKGLEAESLRKLEAQLRRVERAQARANLEQDKLIALAVAVYEETGAPMEAIGNVIGYTKQRVHQFVTDARKQSA